MNLALSIAAPSALVGGEAIGGLSCARAPETISALTAADIIRVLSIVGLQASLIVKETRVSSLTNKLSSARCGSARMEPPRTRGGICAVQRTGSSDRERHARDMRAHDER